MHLRDLVHGFFIGSLFAAPAFAKITPEQASQLGGAKLTGFGAEKAGNADGSIPAYTGPLTTGPATLPSGALADPYASDKVLYTVNASNLGQYSAIVTPGIAAVLQKYPTFHLNVYPTHRSAGYPQWLLDNTKKVATTAELTGNVQGDGVTGAYAGIPFPIPSNGYEVMWDNYLNWNGFATDAANGGGYLVDGSGNVNLTNRTSAITNYSYYDPTRTSLRDSFYYRTEGTTNAPAGEDGQKDLDLYPINYSQADQTIYTYTVGQRRVRLAPEFKYDTPIAANGGAFTYDEINLFDGRPDRWDLKMAGKKEMLISYNNYKQNLPSTSVADFLTPHHPNPDYIRWEKHRVWVVDATLKPGERHIYSRRTFYFDEDTWALVMADAYDQGGRLYRVGFSMPWAAYNAPYPVTYIAGIIYLNLNRGGYATTQWFGGPNNGSVVFKTTPYNQSLFTPENMAGSGIR